MWRSRIGLWLGTIIAALILIVAGVPVEIGAVILVVLIFVWYFASGIVRHIRRRRIINDELDPVGFIERTRYQMTISGRKDNRSLALLTMDVAVGEMCLGKFDEALRILDGMNRSKLSNNNNSELIYTLNRITCLYELGRVEEAEVLFESQVTRLAPVNEYARALVDRVVCERYYYLGKYDAFKEMAEKLMAGRLSKRSRLGLAYRLGLIALEEGEEALAKELLGQVARDGGGLRIRELAEEMVVD